MKHRMYTIQIRESDNRIFFGRVAQYKRGVISTQADETIASYKSRLQDGEVLKIDSWKNWNSETQEHVFIAKIGKKEATRLRQLIQINPTWDEFIDLCEGILNATPEPLSELFTDDFFIQLTGGE